MLPALMEELSKSGAVGDEFAGHEKRVQYTWL
jgi:hypothetical protein